MEQGRPENLMRIGDLSETTGVSVRAIRYYEELGLIEPAGRTEGGYRLYDERGLAALNLIRRLRMLGLSLQEIIGLKRAYSQEGRCGPLVLDDYSHLSPTQSALSSVRPSPRGSR